MKFDKKVIESVMVAGIALALTITAVTGNGVKAVDQVAETQMDKNGMAGVAVAMNAYELEAADMLDSIVSVEKSDSNIVAASAEDTTDVSDTPVESDTSEGVETEPQVAVQDSKDDKELSDEEKEWNNKLMADVDEFLYVRASGGADAEIIGKLYKGDVADVVESGDTWTHVVSGDVDGYVNNDYCVSGEDALAYAQENVETEAQVNTNGLRVRNEASEDASVITAVSEGTTLTVDTDAEAEDGWVAVKYKGQTAYVSADYVTTELALGEAVTIEEEKAALAKKAEEEAAAKAAQTTETSTVQNASVSASYDDVTLLAALIQCEAGNECYEGQLAVGAVVMNRLRSGAYPSSISGVIYQSGQFPPAGQGMVASIAANGPKSSCVQAAQQALGGSDNTGGATCFSRASSGRAGVVIGNHVFY